MKKLQVVATVALDIAILLVKAIVIHLATILARLLAKILVMYIVRNRAQTAVLIDAPWAVVKDVLVLVRAHVAPHALEMLRPEVTAALAVLVVQVAVEAVVMDAHQHVKGDVKVDVVLAAQEGAQVVALVGALVAVTELARMGVKGIVKVHVVELVGVDVQVVVVNVKVVVKMVVKVDAKVIVKAAVQVAAMVQ